VRSLQHLALSAIITSLLLAGVIYTDSVDRSPELSLHPRTLNFIVICLTQCIFSREPVEFVFSYFTVTSVQTCAVDTLFILLCVLYLQYA
jgi:hypothetical protein